MSDARITLARLAELLEVEEGFVLELEQHTLVRADARGMYGRSEIERVRVCWTMHHQLGVNMAGLEVAISLLERWQDERRRTQELLQQLRDELDRRP